MRSDFKIPERRYTWIKLQAWACTHRWEELKKYVKQKKKLPVSAPQVVKLVKQHGGQDVAAKHFLSENDFLSSEEKINLLTDFGMYAEAAAAAFSVRNMEALTSLEEMVAGKDRHLLQIITNYKAKLISK